MQVDKATLDRLDASHRLEIEEAYIANLEGKPEVIFCLRELTSNRRWYLTIREGELREHEPKTEPRNGT